MEKPGNKLYRWLCGINGILLSLYLYAVLLIYCFVNCGERLSAGQFACAALALLIGSCAAAPLMIRIARRVPAQRAKVEPRSCRLWFFGCFILALAPFLFMLKLRYPGVFTGDSDVQYAQAVSGSYNDWHPVLHTLLAFTLPLKLTGVKGSIVLFQMIEFSLALAAMGCAMRRYGGRLWGFLPVLALVLYPQMLRLIIRPWKDNALAIAAVFLMVWALRIDRTDGEWLKSRAHILLFSAFLTAATIFRHNAILFTVPLLFGVCLYASRRQRIALVALFLVLLFLVKVPLYSALDVEKPDRRQTELLGLPMTMIGNVVKEHPESLDEETREFVYAYATQEEWEELYHCGDFNSIKFTRPKSTVIEEAGAATVLRSAWKCLIAEPAASLRALFTLTGLVYSLNPLGALNLGLLLLILSRIDFRSARDRRRLFLVAPLLIHNFGTMFLLTGFDSRFFWLTFPTFPAVALLLLGKPRESTSPQS